MTSRTMTRLPVRLRALMAAAVLVSSLAITPMAEARTITDAWPVLGSDRDGACRLEIVGNGKFMVINATGLPPGTTAHFGLTNATMKPIGWQVVANSRGAWQLIYLPLLYNNADGTVRDYATSGTVSVALDAPRCAVSAKADWKREIRVIP